MNPTNVSYESLSFFWQIFVTLCSVFALIFTWLGRRSNVTNETIEGLHSRINSLTTRVTSVEQAQAHAPTSNDLVAVRGELGRVASAVAELSGKVSGELGGMNRQLQLIQEHLLNKP